MPVYDGDVFYFKAENLSLQLKTIRINENEFENKKQDELNRWKSLVHHMSIYPVRADHYTMLDERFCNDYIEKINDIVLLHNS
jgi:thioesterase domain-containing protein